MAKPTTQQPDSEDFRNLVNLLGVFTESTHRLAEMEAKLNGDVVEIIDDYKADYARLQKALTEAERAIELIATRNTAWFSDRKSLKTPYGTVKFTRSTAVVVKNEELTIEIIRRDAAALGLDASVLIRQQQSLNLEAIGELSDEMLKALRLAKTSRENFSIVPSKVDLGKAVKEAAAQSEAQPAA